MSQPLIARATAEDVPELLSVDTEAFDGPLSATMFPRTPGVRQWREDKLLGWINDPNMAVLKVMGNDGEVAAFARWSKPKTHPDGKEASKTPDIPTDWPCDANTELLQRFFGTLGARRTENMGEVPHWCKSVTLERATRCTVSLDLFKKAGHLTYFQIWFSLRPVQHIKVVAMVGPSCSGDWTKPMRMGETLILKRPNQVSRFTRKMASARWETSTLTYRQVMITLSIFELFVCYVSHVRRQVEYT